MPRLKQVKNKDEWKAIKAKRAVRVEKKRASKQAARDAAWDAAHRPVATTTDRLVAAVSNVEPTPKKCLMLLEKIRLLEQSIREIESSQTECATLLATAIEQEEHWTHQVQSEEKQCTLYASQKSNQESLLQRLEQSMTQTQSALGKLQPSTLGVHSISGTDVSDDMDTLDDAPLDSTIPMEQPGVTEEMDCWEHEPEHETQTGTSDKPNVALESLLPSEDCELSWPNVEFFWNGDRPEPVALSNFLCSITSEATLRAVLDVTTRETLYMDILDPTGQHRAEAMRYTCLDVRLVASSFHASMAARWGVQASAAAHSVSLDPTIALCPFELAGDCADPDCPYQHIGPRASASILPRELLPLPKLGPDDTHRTTSAKMSLVRLNEVRKVELVQPNEESPNTTVGGPGDFVALPEADERYLNENADVEGPKFDFWWKQDPDVTIATATSNRISFSAMLQSLGATISYCVNGQKTLRLHDFSTSRASSRPEWCRLTGMLIDITRFALFAGRFDVSSALLKLASGIHANLAPIDQAFGHVFAMCCRQILDTSASALFAFESKANESLFRQAFEYQAKMVLASFTFQQLCIVLESDSMDQDYLNDWAKHSEFIRERAFATGPTATHAPDEFVSVFASVRLNHDEAAAPSQLVDNVFVSIRTVVALRASILLVKSPRVLVDDILYPAFKMVRKLLGTPCNSYTTMLGGLLFSNIVLDVLESCTNQQLLVGAASDMVVVNDAIDRLLLDVRSLSKSPWMDFLLVPVFAANVALAVYLKRYQTANTRLANLLGTRTIEHHGFAPYSELLWSQMVQLRMSLPMRTIDSSGDSKASRVKSLLEQEPDASHVALVKLVSEMEVFPHHVGLPNDWNIVKSLQSSGVFDTKSNHGNGPKKKNLGNRAFLSSYTFLHRILIGGATRDIQIHFRKQRLSIRNGCEQLEAISSSIPYIVLLGGSFITKLDLSGTGMKRLPLHFGIYFPRLKILDLSRNKLQELPPTMDKMAALEALFISDNTISALPDSFVFPKLTLLFAQNNSLTGLPETVGNCAKLQRLNLQGNPVGPSFWRVVARLRLVELKPQMG